MQPSDRLRRVDLAFAHGGGALAGARPGADPLRASRIPPATFAELASRLVAASTAEDLGVARRALDEVGHLDPSEVPHQLDHYRLDNVARAVRACLGAAAAPMREHFLTVLRPRGLARETDLFAPWLDADVVREGQEWAARAALVVTVPQARRPLAYGGALPGWYGTVEAPPDVLDAIARSLPCSPEDLEALAAEHAIPAEYLAEALTRPPAAPARPATSTPGFVRRGHEPVDSVLLALRRSATPMPLPELARLVRVDEAVLRRRVVGDRRLTSYGDDRWGLRSTHGRPPRARGLGVVVREIVEASPGQLNARQVAEMVSLSMPATRATVTSAISSLSRRDSAHFESPPARPVPAHITTGDRWVALRVRGAARRSSMLGVSRHLHWAVGVDGQRMRRAFVLGDGHDVVVELRDNGRAVVRYLPRVVALLGVGDACELEVRLDLRNDTASARALCACHGDARAA